MTGNVWILAGEVLVEYEYEAKEPDELTLNVGDIITNVVKVADGWCEGTLNGKKGLFPDNFVKVTTTAFVFCLLRPLSLINFIIVHEVPFTDCSCFNKPYLVCVVYHGCEAF